MLGRYPSVCIPAALVDGVCTLLKMIRSFACTVPKLTVAFPFPIDRKTGEAVGKACSVDGDGPTNQKHLL